MARDPEPDSEPDPERGSESGSEHDSEPGSEAPATGLYLYAVIRARGRWTRAAGSGSLNTVRYRDLEALVRPVPWEVPDVDPERLADHQRVVDQVMRRGTVLPVPFGIVFQGRRAVLRFMEDQYIVLEEGLSFLDGHWEMRLHMLGDPEVESLQGTATHLYSELRRLARAAIPLRTESGRVLSAAFLVERSSWIRFVEQVEDLNRAHPELIFDVTGPWPPYDFVQIHL